MNAIETDRLELRPMSREFLEASLASDLERAQRLIRAKLPPDWPHHSDILRMRLGQIERDPDVEPWLLRLMCERASGEAVGHIGFHTGPAPPYLEAYLPGAIELGFSVFPSCRRRGYAREAAIALMDWAYRRHGVTRFVVSIAPSNEASQRLARGLGFRKIGRHLDEIDGEEDVLAWERIASERT